MKYTYIDHIIDTLLKALNSISSIIINIKISTSISILKHLEPLINKKVPS